MISLTPRNDHRRSAFTLIEIMVAIGIIAVLMSLSYTAVSSYAGTAKEAATSTTLIKLQKLIQQRTEGMDRWIEQQRKLGTRGEYESTVTLMHQSINNRMGLPPAVGVSRKVAEILVRKNYFRFLCPQGRRDSTNNSVNPVWRKMLLKHDSTLTAAQINTMSAITDPDQLRADSAELLYFSLTEGEVFGIPPEDSGDFKASEVGDTDNDGLQEFIDAWGHPLRFYRWPTALFNADNNITTQPSRIGADLLVSGLPAPHPLGPSGFWQQDLLYRDPDDPMGRLTGATLDYQARSPNFSTIFSVTSYHSLDTYHVPLVVSPGPDEVLGIREPFENNGLAEFTLADVGAMEDNITSRNRRAGD